MKYMKQLVLMGLLAVCGIQHATAGLILFSDRDAFEAAVDGPLAFDGFNDNSYTLVDLSTGSGFKPYRTTTSHVSEGERARSIREFDTLTIAFEHDVFALGFDLNELNSNNLDYIDSAGHEIIDALMVTDIWNASTFFGLISDTAIRSFSLSGDGDSSNRATYGFDALTFTAPTSVSAPSAFLILLSASIAVFVRRRNRFNR